MWKTIVEELKKAGNNEINTFIDALSSKEESREKIVVNCKSKYAYYFLLVMGMYIKNYHKNYYFKMILILHI